jgi:hypothetical protein
MFLSNAFRKSDFETNFAIPGLMYIHIRSIAIRFGMGT